MTRFERFWFRVGAMVRISVPPASRTPEQRRACAARAFEAWREGKLALAPEEYLRDE